MRIGLVIPLQGVAGLWGLSCEAGATMAALEINGDGGILGKPIEIVTIDAGTNQRDVQWAVRDVLDAGAEALVAMHPSDLRPIIANVIPQHIPYVYTPLYEGGERRPNVFAIGETSEDLLSPGIVWLSQYRGAQRWYLIGSDYAWPRRSNHFAATKIRDVGGQVVGEDYVPFGVSDYQSLFARVRASRPDVVFLSLLGEEAIRFNRAFAEAGLSEQMLRCSLAVDENVLYAIGPDKVEVLFVSSSYFANLRSQQNDAFLERYHGVFGEMPPIQNAFGKSCYEGMHFLAALAEAASSMRADRLRRCLKPGFQFRSTRNRVGLGVKRAIHFAEAQGTQFRIVGSY
jgi:urea transport system substrate-binding protein